MYMIKKMLVIFLSLAMLVVTIPVELSVSALDLDIDISEGYDTLDTSVVFVNTAGEIINSYDEIAVPSYDGVKEKGQPITATCDYDFESGVYEFLGWYINDAKLSSDLNYTFTYNGFLPRARILSKNVLTDASSFESLEAGNIKTPVVGNTKNLYYYDSGNNTYSLVPTGPAPSGHGWGMFSNYIYATHKFVDGEYVEIEGAYKKGVYNGDNYFPIEAIHGEYNHTYYTDYSADKNLLSNVKVTPHSGNVMIGMSQLYRTGIRELTTLKPNTAYELSMWVYQSSPCGRLSAVAVANSYEGVQTSQTESFMPEVEIAGATEINYINYGQWQKITLPFITGEETTYYLHLSQDGQGVNGAYSKIFLDDLAVVEVEMETISGRDLIESEKCNTQSYTPVNGTSAQFNYTGSGVEFKLNCSGIIKANFTAKVGNPNWDLRYALHINGERQKDIILTGGPQTVILATHLPQGIYTIKIERMSEEQIGKVTFDSLTFDGRLISPPEKRENHIDFFGDSITAGWGTTYYDSSGEVLNHYQYMDGTITYAALTAAALDANYNAFGYSGWGVAVGERNMTTIHPDLPKNLNADYVVVNLGTNDASKYASQGLTAQQVKDAYLNYARMLRADYGPNTPIIFAGGMMTDRADDFINYAVDTLKTEGDKKIYSVKLPRGTSGGVGHPNAAEHIAAAKVLTEFIKTISATLAGDVNFDGTVKLDDVTTLAKYVTGWNVTVNEDVKDINDDGKTGLNDVVTLAQYIAGWSDVAMKGTVYDSYNPVTHTLKEIQSKLKLNSRATIDGDVLRMEWSYSGFTIQGQFSGDIVLTNVKTTNTALMYAVLDEDLENAVEIIVPTGGTDITVLKDIAPGFHTIQLFKASEASASIITAEGIKYNGAFFPRPADKARKIQFIGDSITSASGLYTPEVEPNSLYRNDISKGYAIKVADYFDADLSIVSISGGAICAKNPYMREYYQREFYSKNGAYDFSKETAPDLVVISLGTNDTPTFLNGSVAGDNVDQLKQGITTMLETVRSCNPNATILWAYGMMDMRIPEVYKETVEAFAKTDGNTYFTLIGRNDCNGDYGHPTPDGHTANSREYIAYIATNIWND